MPDPALNLLPDPPQDRYGWPWTESAKRLPEMSHNDKPWPKISIVTPSYNQGHFIEETIRSVLLQGYPNLEYIIIDGSSTDSTIEIIKKYASWISYWVSEPDQGQADAVNKGWRRSSGQLLGWLNSDDRYEAGALETVAGMFVQDLGTVMIYGDCDAIDHKSEFVGKKTMNDYGLESLLFGRQMPQPAVFVGRSAAKKIGFLDKSLQWALDTDFFIKMWLEYEPDSIHYIAESVASSRVYSTTKTSVGVERITRERRLVLENVGSNVKWKSKMKANYTRALGHTYIKEANLQFKAGKPFSGVVSLLRALITNPGYYSKRGIDRILSTGSK